MPPEIANSPATSGEDASGAVSSRLGVVVVTFNRPDALSVFLKAVFSQDLRPDEVVVVNNGSVDSLQEVNPRLIEAVRLINLDNAGPAGGFEAGVRVAYEAGCDWIALFNDDTEPDRDLLASLVKRAEQYRSDSRKIGMAAPVGVDPETGVSRPTGIQWRGRPVPVNVEGAGSGPVSVDGVTFNGGLLSSEAVRAVGFPKPDYFMMFEEWEYCLRIRRAGFEILLLPDLTLTDDKMGSVTGSPPWRGYYQTRNQLAFVIEQRSLSGFLWWSRRQVAYALSTVLHRDRKWERLWLRALATFHALTGKMGRTIEPG